MVKYLIEGHHYKFRISAENQLGCSDWAESEIITATNPTYPPAPPRSLEIADVGKDFIFVTWTKPAKNGGSLIKGDKQVLGVSEAQIKISLARISCILC